MLPVNALKVIEPYKPDIEFYALPTDRNANFLAMNAEQLAIFSRGCPSAMYESGSIGGIGEKSCVKVAI